MSQELTTIEVGEVVVVPTLAESESKIKGIARRVKRAQDTAVASMESARTDTERGDLEMGEELIVIKKSGSFKEAGFRFWSHYEAAAAERLGFSDRRVRQLIQGAGVTEPFIGISEGNENPSEIPIPANAEQRLEVSRVPVEQRAVVLEQTIKVEGKLTARGIRETAERIAKPTPTMAELEESREFAELHGVDDAEIRPELLLLAWASEIGPHDDKVWVGNNISVADVKRWVREVVTA